MNFWNTQTRELRTFWRGGFSGETGRAALAFVLLGVIGFGICRLNPAVLDRVMSMIADYFGNLNLTEQDGSISAPGLLMNNLRACAATLLFGLVPFVYLSSLSLGINAMLLGAMAAYYVKDGSTLVFYLAAILPHGIFELPALILSFALGLMLCRQMTLLCRRKENAAAQLSRLPVQILRVFLLLILPLLAAAAFMEANVTPLILNSLL
jgi:Uncharacterized membrane protein